MTVDIPVIWYHKLRYISRIFYAVRVEISCLTVKKMKKDNVGGDSVVERLMEESGDSCTGRYMETGDLQIE